MELIPISYLNDFLFCPYSIYLHRIYSGTEEETVHAVPQIAGTRAHDDLEHRRAGTPALVQSLPVYSETLGIHGVIDELDTASGTLTEYKNKITAVFPGQKMQLYSQYFCLTEIGYEVNAVRLVEIASGKEFPLPVPNDRDREELAALAEHIRKWNPDREIPVNPNKCRKCIYCALCEKTEEENVF